MLVISSCNLLNVSFCTDSSVTRTGFSLTYNFTSGKLVSILTIKTYTFATVVYFFSECWTNTNSAICTHATITPRDTRTMSGKLNLANTIVYVGVGVLCMFHVQTNVDRDRLWKTHSQMVMSKVMWRMSVWYHYCSSQTEYLAKHGLCLHPYATVLNLKCARQKQCRYWSDFFHLNLPSRSSLSVYVY